MSPGSLEQGTLHKRCKPPRAWRHAARTGHASQAHQLTHEPPDPVQVSRAPPVSLSMSDARYTQRGTCALKGKRRLLARKQGARGNKGQESKEPEAIRGKR